MQLEHLYEIKRNAPPGTVDAHICAALMVEEQHNTCTFVITEWQKE